MLDIYIAMVQKKKQKKNIRFVISATNQVK